MNQLPAVLVELAQKYKRWQEESAPSLRRIIAEIMNSGDLKDVLRVEEILGRDVFLDAIKNAQPGWYTQRSWTFWNSRLGIVGCGCYPRFEKSSLRVPTVSGR